MEQMEHNRSTLEQLVNNCDVLGVLEHLKNIGISNRKVCNLCGVNFTTVHRYKKGEFDLGEDKKYKILNTVKDVFL